MTEHCRHCGGEIRTQIQKGTGYCCQRCELEAARGLPPEAAHIYQAGYSGMVCDVMVLRGGYGDSCGLPPKHPIHVQPPPPNPLLMATVDDNPAVPLSDPPGKVKP